MVPYFGGLQHSFLHFLVENFPGEQHLRSLVLATGGENGAWEWGVSIWWMTEGKVRWKKVGDLRVSAFFIPEKKGKTSSCLVPYHHIICFFLGCGCDWIGGTNWWCWWSEIWPIVLLRTKSSLQQTQNPRVSNDITRVMPALIDVTPKQPAHDVMMRRPDSKDPKKNELPLAVGTFFRLF